MNARSIQEYIDLQTFIAEYVKVRDPQLYYEAKDQYETLTQKETA